MRINSKISLEKLFENNLFKSKVTFGNKIMHNK